MANFKTRPLAIRCSIGLPTTYIHMYLFFQNHYQLILSHIQSTFIYNNYIFTIIYQLLFNIYHCHYRLYTYDSHAQKLFYRLISNFITKCCMTTFGHDCISRPFLQLISFYTVLQKSSAF